MTDLAHQFGSDLSWGANGDLLTVAGPDETLQRVLKRLLTIPGNYIWHLSYGAGLPTMIGQPSNTQRINAIARAQMYQEAGVARTPPPVTQTVSGVTGSVFLNITYTDANTGDQRTESFQI